MEKIDHFLAKLMRVSDLNPGDDGVEGVLAATNGPDWEERIPLNSELEETVYAVDEDELVEDLVGTMNLE